VTALRVFDVGTQRTFRDQEAVQLLPALEPEGGRRCSPCSPRLVVADGALGPEAAGLPEPGLVVEDAAQASRAPSRLSG
jgi:hypothetical protein